MNMSMGNQNIFKYIILFKNSIIQRKFFYKQITPLSKTGRNLRVNFKLLQFL